MFRLPVLCRADALHLLSLKLDCINLAVRGIYPKLEKIMSDQDTLNADAAAFVTALNTIAAEIAALQQQASQGQPLDFTAINGALAQAQAIANPAPPPAA